MIELNLETKTKEQQLVKKYLQQNVSETLADKINNGVQITKDNKQLINKKNLDKFFSYAKNLAYEYAKRIASGEHFEENEYLQGACINNTQPEAQRSSTKKGDVNSNPTYACIEDKTVFSWAIYYFEEDSIEGNLYNLDGSEYKVINPKVESKPKQQPKKAAINMPRQQTMFDLFEDNNQEDKNEEFESNIDEIKIEDYEPNIAEFDGESVDLDTGEIITPNHFIKKKDKQSSLFNPTNNEDTVIELEETENERLEEIAYRNNISKMKNKRNYKSKKFPTISTIYDYSKGLS